MTIQKKNVSTLGTAKSGGTMRKVTASQVTLRPPLVSLEVETSLTTNTLRETTIKWIFP